MYYTNIADNEVKEFHQKAKVNASYNETSNYVDRSQTNKAIPLFYSDKITGNENIRVIDNRIILYINWSDLDSVHFQSETKNSIGVFVDTLTVGTKDFIHLHFYNSNNNLNVILMDFRAVIKDSNDEVILTINDKVDDYGNYVIEYPTGATSITVTANNQTFGELI